MREIGGEAMALVNEPLEGSGGRSRQARVRTATRAGQMHVLGFRGAVVFDTIFEMRVSENAEVIQKPQRSIDGRGIDARNSFADSCGQPRGVDVVFGAHHLGENRAPLGRDSEPPLTQHLQDRLGRLFDGHWTQISSCTSLLQRFAIARTTIEAGFSALRG